MGLFDKKFCSVCGEKIGLLGNRKLEDGNLCKDCTNKLSPWFDERRHSTVAEIEEQLRYREENKKEVEKFNPTRVLGRNGKIYLDEGQKKAQRHSPQMPKSKYTELSLDMLQTGVGGINSWNKDAQALPQYRVKYQDRLFKFWLIPYTGKE